MRIVFLEDDSAFADGIIALLESAGHDVAHFLSGRACLRALDEFQYDLALLDWMLPDITGAEVLESLKVKGSAMPVIFLTARDTEEDVVAIMNAGADDYIVKPTGASVLMARINALYRRVHSHQNDVAIKVFGHITIDFSKRQFAIKDEAVKLTEKEIDLALCFFSQVGVLLSRSHLTKVVWRTTPDIDTRTLDVHVSHLRNKLKLMPEHGWRLSAVYHQGYRLEAVQ
jgi:two-component system, OmpR family, response regulator RegX3